MTEAAYDLLYRATKEFHDSLAVGVGMEVEADPASVFRVGGFEPDPAQLELLQCQDQNVLVLWTRQFAGKSQAAAALALHHAMTNLGKQGRGSMTLVFSAGQREAIELLRKVRHLRYGLVRRYLPAFKRSWRPRSVARDVREWQRLALSSGRTDLAPAPLPAEVNAVVDGQTLIELENGSRIVSLPAKSQAVVGYTADLLILDEAKIIPDDLYKSVRPMLAVAGGRMIALTTPLGQRGWFYEAWKQCDQAKQQGQPEPYRRFKRTCWECPRKDVAFLELERKLIGDIWFRQEYEVEFVSLAGAVFRSEEVDSMFQSTEEPYELPW